MAGSVFISYSQPDRGCAFELVERLEEQGIDCWIAPRDIAPSADWAAEIMDAISSASAMILVFSASSNQSPQVRREVERAVHKQLSILPFRIEDVLPSKSLEFFLSTQHWMDAFPPPREPHYARLCAHLKKEPAAVESAASRALTPRTSAPGTSAPDTSAPDRDAAAFDSVHLLHIERQLAGYIGPLAKHLVKSAAAHAADADDLVERLAGELDMDAERSEFIQRCRMPRRDG